MTSHLALSGRFIPFWACRATRLGADPFSPVRPFENAGPCLRSDRSQMELDASSPLSVEHGSGDPLAAIPASGSAFGHVESARVVARPREREAALLEELSAAGSLRGEDLDPDHVGILGHHRCSDPPDPIHSAGIESDLVRLRYRRRICPQNAHHHYGYHGSAQASPPMSSMTSGSAPGLSAVPSTDPFGRPRRTPAAITEP